MADGVIGKTHRGLAVYSPTHPTYAHLERVRMLGADHAQLGHLARQAQPGYRAVDHEEASAMHYARHNFHAARAHEAASTEMSKSAADAMVPAYASNLAWVYEGVDPSLSLEDAAGAITAVTLSWQPQDHLDAAVLNQALAQAHGESDTPEDLQRQALCAGAAYMHFAAAGVDPTTGPTAAMLTKAMSPRALTPHTPRQPTHIGTTRSGKAIFDLYHHPAHKDFTTADWHDAGQAVAKRTLAGNDKVVRIPVKKSGEGSRGGKVIGHTKSGKPIYGDRAARHQSYNHFNAQDHEDAREVHFDQADNASRVFDRENLAPGEGDKSDWKNAAKRHVGHATGHGSAALALKQIEKSNKPLGAAFSHARKVAAKTGGGKAKEREVAQRYLSKKGHGKMGKSKEDDTTKSLGDRAGEDAGMQTFLIKAAGMGTGKALGTIGSGKTVYGHKMREYSKPAIGNSVATAPPRAEEHVSAVRMHNVRKVMRAHPTFTAEDHVAAGDHIAGMTRGDGSPGDQSLGYQMRAHRQAAKVMNQPIKKSYRKEEDDMQTFLIKAEGGEGSRGGKIIGHTKSGKPVYASGHDHYQAQFRDRGASQGISPLTSSRRGNSTARQGAHALRGRYKDFSAADHHDAAEIHEQQSDMMHKQHHQLIQSAAAKHHPGKAFYERPMISGGVDPAYGEKTNNKIRNAVHEAQDSGDAATLHSHAARLEKRDENRSGTGIKKSLDALHPSDGLHQMGSEFAQKHPDMSASDHMAASKKYASAGQPHMAIGHMMASSYKSAVAKKSAGVDVLKDYLSKAEPKALGETSSGKPIHNHDHPSYSGVKSYTGFGSESRRANTAQRHELTASVLASHPTYSKLDHHQAWAAHRDKAMHLGETTPTGAKHLGIAMGHFHAKNTGGLPKQPKVAKSLSKAKGGEGSRGGKIIGHTKSGKPIYSSGSAHYDGVKSSAWTNPIGEPADKRFPHYTKEDHKDAAELHMQNSHKAGVTVRHKKVVQHLNAAMAHEDVAKSMGKSDNGFGGTLQMVMPTAWAPRTPQAGPLVVN